MVNVKKISIITVCWNSVKTISRTLDSVLSQIKQGDEYIIVDGGSTDGTLEYIQSLEDKRIVLIENIHGGVYRALNIGLDECKNEIIGIIHSDDFYLPGVIEKVKQYFNEEIDIYFGAIWKESNNKFNLISCEVPTSKGSIKLHHVHPAVFVKKATYGSTGFSEKYTIAADLDFFCNCYKDGARFKKSNTVFAVMAAGGISDTKRSLALLEGVIIRGKHGDYLGILFVLSLYIIKAFKKRIY